MTRIAVAVFIVVIAAFVGLALFIPHANKTLETGPVATTSAEVVTPIVTLKDVYKKGTHTISGSLEAPNPCTSISTDPVVTLSTATGTPDSIHLAISMPHDVGICLQQVTQATFSVTASAGAGAIITTDVNGITASTTSL